MALPSKTGQSGTNGIAFAMVRTLRSNADFKCLFKQPPRLFDLMDRFHLDGFEKYLSI